jgi:putative transposase
LNAIESREVILARQLRIEYPGAFYHVFSRGNQKQPVFLSDDDMLFFLKCLREAHDKFGVIVHVYCLMPNHYHLILETPLGNLSKIMHFLNTTYTIYFNKKHKRCGHLFQGRYKSILIEAESYAQELSRYIHLNPVRSEIVELPEQYPWSSYECYRGKAKPEKWLDTGFILSLFGNHPDKARSAYTKFVLEGIGKEVPDSIRNSVRKGILGSDEFITRIRKEYLGDKLEKPDREKPQLKKLQKKPDLLRVLYTSKKALGPNNRMAVPIAILICHNCTEMKLQEIGEVFSLSISGVSNACARARAAIARNVPLARVAEELEKEIRESVKEMT